MDTSEARLIIVSFSIALIVSLVLLERLRFIDSEISPRVYRKGMMVGITIICLGLMGLITLDLLVHIPETCVDCSIEWAIRW